MDIIDLDEINEKDVVQAIRAGALFAYPTDTIYGIGCNALDREAVLKIRGLKRTSHPFSVIAPTRKWVQENVKVKHPGFLKKLPGRYTLIFRKKMPGFLKECSPGKTLGVRIPDHPFTELVKRAGVPFVTTSVNRSGKVPMKKIPDIPEKFERAVDFAIDAGVLAGKPSSVFDLTGEKPRQLR